MQSKIVVITMIYLIYSNSSLFGVIWRSWVFIHVKSNCWLSKMTFEVLWTSQNDFCFSWSQIIARLLSVVWNDCLYSYSRRAVFLVYTPNLGSRIEKTVNVQWHCIISELHFITSYSLVCYFTFHLLSPKLIFWVRSLSFLEHSLFLLESELG